jgi:hypothetical protein
MLRKIRRLLKMDKKAKIVTIATLVLIVILTIGLVTAKGGLRAPKPECNDKLDNDGDGFVDLSDKGCNNKKDNDETNCGDGVCEGGETSNACPADCPVCGNNIKEGSEVCDGTDLSGQTCASQGFDGGTLACNARCDGFDASGCFTDTCSDSDGSINIFTQGTVSGDLGRSPYSNTDFCLDTTMLMEFYCSGNRQSNFTNECFSNSTSGTTCVSGACV